MEGVNKKLGLFGDYVDVFKGIPYAATPKVLEKPQRHPGWQGGNSDSEHGEWGSRSGWTWALTSAIWLSPGTLKAKDFKKRCLQATITQDSSYGSEDCLYLNIWVPQGKREGMGSPIPLVPYPATLQQPQ